MAASRIAQLCALTAASFTSALLTPSVAIAQPAASEQPAASAQRAASAAPDAEADLTDERASARAAFERGVALARDGRYEEAKAAFLAAYAAHPHYLVLYNVAQAEERLGNLGSAVDYLERFLREGGASADPEQRARVNAQIAELRERSPAAPPASGALPGALPRPTRASPAEPDWLRAPASTATPAPTAPLGAPVTSTEASWGLVLGVSGGVLLGLASGLYLWNDTRQSKWNDDRQRLDSLPNRDQALRTDPAVWQQAKSNNELLESIQRVDVATLVTGGVGALALGAGVWAVLAQPGARDPAVVASGNTLIWRTKW